MRKLNEFEPGDLKEYILKILLEKKEKVEDKGQLLLTRKLTYYFDSNFKLIEIIKVCANCKTKFTLAYGQYIYTWCNACNVKNQQRYHDAGNFPKGKTKKPCMVCGKEFKSDGLRICSICSPKLDNPEYRVRVYSTGIKSKLHELIEM